MISSLVSASLLYMFRCMRELLCAWNKGILTDPTPGNEKLKTYAPDIKKNVPRSILQTKVTIHRAYLFSSFNIFNRYIARSTRSYKAVNLVYSQGYSAQCVQHYYVIIMRYLQNDFILLIAINWANTYVFCKIEKSNFVNAE